VNVEEMAMKLTEEQKQRLISASSGRVPEQYARLPAVNTYSKRLQKVIDDIRLESPEAFINPFGDEKSINRMKTRSFYHEPANITTPLTSFVVGVDRSTRI
jgi:hypothetical protein